MSMLIVDQYKNKRWYYPIDILHRVNGPAIEMSDGTKAWYINGDLNREDGPAIEYIHGGKEWWLNGIEYTKEKYKNKMRLYKLKHILD